MKGLYRLINYEFSLMFKAALIISGCALLLPLLLIHSEMKEIYDYSVHERFEDIYTSSGSVILFVILFAILCLWFLKSFYAGYWGSKSVYTLLTLPVKRESVYFSKLIAFAICILLLIVAQIISVFWGYGMVISRVEGFDEGQYVMTNGLFLAFIRSGFLRLMLPLSLVGFVSSLGILTIMITGVFYGAICERSKRYWGYVFIAFAVYLVIKVINIRVSDPVQELYFSISPTSLYVYSFLLFSLSGFFVWHSVRLIRKGAIT